jgi:hypothetical protein
MGGRDGRAERARANEREREKRGRDIREKR